MYRLLATVTLLRGIELTFLALVLYPALTMSITRFILGLAALSFTVLVLASVITYVVEEKSNKILLLTSTVVAALDLCTLVKVIYSGNVTLLLVYVSSVVNTLLDLVLLLLAVELVRK